MFIYIHPPPLQREREREGGGKEKMKKKEAECERERERVQKRAMRHLVAHGGQNPGALLGVDLVDDELPHLTTP